METKEESLRTLKEQLVSANLDDLSIFQELFSRGVQLLDLEIMELAGAFQISRATTQRWITGESAPHPEGRDAVFKLLIQLIERKEQKE